MIDQSLIIALLVLSIHYTMLDGEIFGKLGSWFTKHLPKVIHPSIFECNVCMTPWYGSVIYVLLWGVNWQWPIVVITAMGFNIIINKWSKDDNDIPLRVKELEKKVEEINPTVT